MVMPYRVDVPIYRLPYANWLIVGLCCVAFAYQFVTPQEAWEKFVLTDMSHPLGLFGYAWLHGDPFHLIGNMVFLWVFGNAVCAKLGNIFYIPVYLFLGLVSGIAHAVFTGGDCIGASGAVNGIVGMFLIWYPRNDVSCLYWLGGIIPRTFTVSSYWMILLWFVFDILGIVLEGEGVAYFAHVGGFLTGAVIAIALLQSGLIRMLNVEQSLLSCLGIKDSYFKGNAPEGFGNIKRVDDEGWVHVNNADYAASVAAQSKADTIEAEPPAPVAPEQAGLSADDIFFNAASASSTSLGTEPEPAGFDMGYDQGPAVVEEAPPEMIRFRCVCGKGFKVAPSKAGKKARCPKCTQVIRIPQA